MKKDRAEKAVSLFSGAMPVFAWKGLITFQKNSY
jgi:hypothetical protein